jgi:hypothetical protein
MRGQKKVKASTFYPRTDKRAVSDLDVVTYKKSKSKTKDQKGERPCHGVFEPPRVGQESGIRKTEFATPQHGF